MNLMDEDVEKLKFYSTANFYFHDSLLFSSIVKQPSNEEIIRLKTKLKKKEIEYLYNHFHLSSINENVDRQRELAIELWKKWRHFFNSKFPDKQISIEILDSPEEVIIYVFQTT